MDIRDSFEEGGVSEEFIATDEDGCVIVLLMELEDEVFEFCFFFDFV